MAIPNFLKGYSLFVDGIGYAGKADVTLPDLKVVTEEHAAGGMSAKVKVDMGMVEALDAKFKIYEYSPAIIGLWGRLDASATQIVFRGAEVDESGNVVPVKVTMRGQIQEVGMGEVSAGSKTQMDCTASLRYYRLDHGGATVVEIDAERMIRSVGGSDQMAAIRGAIGL
jgi:uncharacterized protein